MQSNAYPVWGIRGVTFGLSALVAASVAYWGLKVSNGMTPADQAVPVVMVAAPAPVDPQAVAKALGAAPAAAADAPNAPTVTSSRYVLVGVVAGGVHGAGAALIAIDGKTARPVRVGAAVDDQLMLQSVTGRRAVLANRADAQPAVTLDMPALGK